MKRRFAGVILFFLIAAFSCCFICAAQAEETHEHTYVAEKYEYLDETSHVVSYKCTYCNDVKTETENHDWSYYVTRYEYIDPESHYAVLECLDCKAEKKVKEDHVLDSYTESYSKIDDSSHYAYYDCDGCDGIIAVEEEHSFSDEVSRYEKCDEYSHYAVYKCDDCGAEKKKKKDHEYYYDDAVVKKYATYKSKGTRVFYCDDCGQSETETFKWERGDDGSRDYNITGHSTLYKDSTSITIRLASASKGCTLKVKIGKNQYSKKISNNSKKVKIKIKKPAYSSRITITLYYKSKLIGEDACESTDYVLYGKKVKVGMTKKQVLWVWGRPSSTSSGSGGWSYWYWDDYSYVIFRNGKVYRWYNSAG